MNLIEENIVQNIINYDLLDGLLDNMELTGIQLGAAAKRLYIGYLDMCEDAFRSMELLDALCVFDALLAKVDWVYVGNSLLESYIAKRERDYSLNQTENGG